MNRPFPAEKAETGPRDRQKEDALNLGEGVQQEAWKNQAGEVCPRGAAGHPARPIFEVFTLLCLLPERISRGSSRPVVYPVRGSFTTSTFCARSSRR